LAIVTIQSPALSDIQKKRIGERVLDSLHSEGIPASSIVVLFRPEDTDIFLDGGLLFEARPQHHPAPAASSSTITTVPKKPHVDIKEPAPASAPTPPRAQSGRKAIPEYSEVKEKVRTMLLNHGGLSSFQAQDGLALKGYDGASAILRRVFADLEAEGMVEKLGQKRGTRYVLKGITSAPTQQAAPVILVKQQDKPELTPTPAPAPIPQDRPEFTHTPAPTPQDKPEFTHIPQDRPVFTHTPQHDRPVFTHTPQQSAPVFNPFENQGNNANYITDSESMGI